ncbi:hypothetical protein HMPREF1514_0419 [Streptococcus sp. AS20]|uniref:Uncharacterized protein n=1 Tax=Streptococcus constellatus subsp. pharyngis SK1060 = CCUG 46377 TaxID=1035184 RepID=F9P4R2_STRCV|nr:hypothetical protein HMPREF1042_0461 [Streptococcus constellatus subsp. pharyngis SK1060 = CCUG 46377]EUB24745.1 hypothetical protein HMPREF1514_0419 [Streptococcus sp. AS20]
MQGKGVRNMKIDDHPGPQKLSQLLMLRIPHEYMYISD